MSFSSENNDVTLLSVLDGVLNGLLAVLDHDVLTVGLFDAGLYVLHDGFRILESRIVRSDDREIRQLTGHLAHLVASELRTVTAAAEDSHDPARIVLPDGSQQALERHSVVRVIDHQSKII